MPTETNDTTAQAPALPLRDALAQAVMALDRFADFRNTGPIVVLADGRDLGSVIDNAALAAAAGKAALDSPVVTLGLESLLTDKESGQRTLRELMESLLVTCAEGGSSYWCDSILPRHHGENTGSPWYTVAFHSDQGDGAAHALDYARGVAGLRILAEKQPHQFAMLMRDKACSDAEVSDCWLQCAMLGDVVYG